MTIKKRLLSGGIWVLGAKIIAAIAALTVNGLLTRLLEPQEVGVYFLVFSLITIVAAVGLLGLNRAVVRLIAAAMAHDQQTRARAIIIYTLLFSGLGLLFFALTFIYGFGDYLAYNLFQSELMVSVLGIATLWVIVFGLQSLLAEQFRGLHNLKLASVLNGSAASVILAVLLTWLWLTNTGATLSIVVLFSVIAVTLTTLTGLALILRRIRDLTSGGTFSISELPAVAFPLLVTSIAIIAISELHIWILSYFQPKEEVALFGAAIRLMNLSIAPLLIINSIIPATVAELYAKGEHTRLERIARITATIAGIPAAAVLLTIILFSSDIMRLIFGDFYQQAGLTVTVLAIGHLVNVLTGSPGAVLIAAHKERIVMAFSLISGISGLIVSLIAVQWIHPEGVAIGVSFGLITLNLAMWWHCKKYLHINTHGSFRCILEARQLLKH